LARFKTFFAWAIHQHAFRRASIPYLKMQKKRKKEKSTTKIDQNDPNPSKTAEKLEKWPREIALFDDLFKILMLQL
jgi:predicted amidophosphoribosyltransferase